MSNSVITALPVIQENGSYARADVVGPWKLNRTVAHSSDRDTLGRIGPAYMAPDAHFACNYGRTATYSDSSYAVEWPPGLDPLKKYVLSPRITYLPLYKKYSLDSRK